MSELKTNKISTNDTDNVAIDNPLQLKSYTTSQRNALTSSAGDAIYNSTDNEIQYYDGTSWIEARDTKVPVQYVVIAGGGSGAASPSAYGAGGGGGAGGYRSSYASENTGGGKSTELKAFVETGTSYTVTIGGGGAAATSSGSTYVEGNRGNDSEFAGIHAEAGGAGGQLAYQDSRNRGGGSGGGGGTRNSSNPPGGLGTVGQGFDGGTGASYAQGYAGAGGGGAGAVGQSTTSSAGGNGGAGVSSSITGSAVGRAGGGGGGRVSSGTNGTASDGGGAAADGTATAATQYTGGGGGAGSGVSANGVSGAGGSGVVILRYPDRYSITLAGGATSTGGETTVGTNEKYIQIETSGTVSWA
jgi:hypothetical protein